MQASKCKHCGTHPYIMQRSIDLWFACCTTGCEKRNGKNTSKAGSKDAVIDKWNKRNKQCKLAT